MDSLMLIRGIASIVIGILAVGWPGMTIALLIGIFGAYAIIDGITNLFIGFSPARAGGRSWAYVAQGLVGIAAGVLTFLWPGVTALALVFFIAAWAVATGVIEIVAAIRLRKVIQGEWLLALSGALSVAFGVLVFAFPAAGAVGIAFVLGIYAIAAGADPRHARDPPPVPPAGRVKTHVWWTAAQYARLPATTRAFKHRGSRSRTYRGSSNRFRR
jgi:uncharacterized membrane protein HdeD (DUF308 family)